jgi:UDP-N-acetylmuramate-alanine ligase
VPGDHIHHDACLAYAAARLLGLKDEEIIPKLESYSGSWRRSEVIKTTQHGNILISDY